MTLEKFAKKCCFVLTKDGGPEWGGKYCYTTPYHPSVMSCGFKTKREAVEAWFVSTFGQRAGEMVMNVLEKNDE